VADDMTTAENHLRYKGILAVLAGTHSCAVGTATYGEGDRHRRYRIPPPSAPRAPGARRAVEALHHARQVCRWHGGAGGRVDKARTVKLTTTSCARQTRARSARCCVTLSMC
jgi:hypothetical protein